MQIGDTIRVRHDEPNMASIKGGTHGTIQGFTREGNVLARFPGGMTWQLEPSDFDVIEVGDAFAALVGSMGLEERLDVNALRGLYDESGFEALPGIPVETPSDPVPMESGDVEDEGSDVLDFDHSDCPDEPHTHTEDGSILTLPFVALTDADNDILIATDVRPVTADSDNPATTRIGLVIRINRPSGDALEVHLTEAQAIALAAFLLKNYR